MRLKDIPIFPAYLVNHDQFDKGAMEVWPCYSMSSACQLAKDKNDKCEAQGFEPNWKAYEKLPRVKIWKYHTEVLTVKQF